VPGPGLETDREMLYSPRRMNRVPRPLAFLYQMGSTFNNFLFDHKVRQINRAPLPVISVGNLAFGGSEKTPLVMHLLSYFKEQQRNPALITRGYKGRWEKSGGVLSDGQNIYGTWREAGDEPFMIWRSFPDVGIFIGKNRLISCQKAEQAGFSPLILDDGFQHRQLHRDLDIVLFSSDQGAALREPLSSLRRAHIILVKEMSRLPAHRLQQNLSPQGKIFSYSTINRGFFAYPEGSPIQTERLKRKRLLTICGIARPERFFSLLEKEGLKPSLSLVYPDHHTYPLSTKNKIIAAIQKVKADAVLTTEKDVFKLEEISTVRKIPFFYNKIDLMIEDGFYRELHFLAKDI
jgi:tetraacyldisaccharide 4'-kinase